MFCTFARSALGSLIATALLLTACAPSNDAEGTPGNDASDAQNEHVNTDAAASDDVEVVLDVNVGDSAPQGIGCSGDLEHVIDGEGNIVMTCPPHEGCLKGQCVAACDAAAGSPGSLGCHFVVATPSSNSTFTPPCFAVFLANSWGKAAQLTVSRAGQTFDIAKFARVPDGVTNDAAAWPLLGPSGLAPGKGAILFLSSDPNSTWDFGDMFCPVEPALNASTAVFGGIATEQATGMGEAWMIDTDVPVTAYDFIPYRAAGFDASGELLFPTTAWGSNYLAFVPQTEQTIPKSGWLGQDGPTWAQIVAASDDTHVTVFPTVNLPSGAGVNPAPSGVSTEYKLNRGQYVQWQDASLFWRSVIQSDKPIAFNAGETCSRIVSKTTKQPIPCCCDGTHQQVPAISALGSEYVVAAYQSRMKDNQPESIPYWIFGLADATTLTYDPPIVTAPKTLDKAQPVLFETTQSFVVRAQDAEHPFYVGQMMTGSQLEGISGCGPGDPEHVTFLPPAQFLSKYVFFTNPLFPTTTLVAVRVKSKTGFKDVNLDCLGSLEGWKDVGSTGQYQMTYADLVRNGSEKGTCTNGSHVAQSDAPFWMVVWGLEQCNSYAYPVGGNAAKINPVTIEPGQVK